MDPGLRTTQALTARIDRHRDDLIKHYEALISLIGTKNPSRNTTAILQYQIQVETAALVRAGEELHFLIRQMQEMWLFGQLNTLGESQVQQQTDENARVVGELLGKIVEMQRSTGEDGAREGRVANGVSRPQARKIELS